MTIPMRRLRVRGLAGCVVLLSFAVILGAQTSATPPQNSPQSAPPAPGPNWKTYTYAPDGFSASFPFAPDLQKRSVPTDAGSFELRSYIGTDGDVAMFVGVADYGSVISGKDPNTLLQAAKSGALENSKSRLVSEKPITFGVYPGLTFEAESDTAHFSARMYMVGSTLYQILVVYALGKPYADTARFLDSFQLVARPG